MFAIFGDVVGDRYRAHNERIDGILLQNLRRMAATECLDRAPKVMAAPAGERYIEAD